MEVSLKGAQFRKLMELQFAQIRETYHLKMIEIDVLYFLSRPSMFDTPTDIYHQLKLNRGHISQAIDGLCQKDYLMAAPDREDHRCVHYQVTEKAQPVIRDIQAVRRALDQEIFKEIPQDELEIFKSVFKKVCLNLQEMLG